MKLAHHVYFTLDNNSAEAQQDLISDCQTYLTDHPGIEYLGVGTLADLARSVNDRGFDVALLVVFADRAAHDAYQQADRHLEFIERNKSNWRQVRVFDFDMA